MSDICDPISDPSSLFLFLLSCFAFSVPILLISLLLSWFQRCSVSSIAICQSPTCNILLHRSVFSLIFMICDSVICRFLIKLWNDVTLLFHADTALLVLMVVIIIYFTYMRRFGYVNVPLICFNFLD